MNFIEKTCFKRTFVLILVFWSMFPYELALVYGFTQDTALKRFISSKCDNSVQTLIITENTCFQWQIHVLNVFLRRI